MSDDPWGEPISEDDPWADESPATADSDLLEIFRRPGVEKWPFTATSSLNTSPEPINSPTVKLLASRAREYPATMKMLAEQHKVKYGGDVRPVELEIEAQEEIDRLYPISPGLRALEQAEQVYSPRPTLDEILDPPSLVERASEPLRPVWRAGVEVASLFPIMASAAVNMPAMTFNVAVKGAEKVGKFFGARGEIELLPTSLQSDIETINKMVDYAAPEAGTEGSLYQVTKFMSSQGLMYLFGAWAGKLGSGISKAMSRGGIRSAEQSMQAAMRGKEFALTHYFSTLSSGAAVSDAISTARSQGVEDEQHLNAIASTAAVVGYPVAMFFMRWNPLLRYYKSGGRVQGQTLGGRFGLAAVQGAAEETGESIPLQAVKLLTGAEQGREVNESGQLSDYNLVRAVFQHSIPNIFVDMGAGAVGGGFIAGVDAVRNGIGRRVDPKLRELSRNLLGKDPNIYEAADLTRQAIQEFGADYEKAQWATEIFDRFVKTKAKREGVTPQEMWLITFARMAERQMPGERLYMTEAAGAWNLTLRSQQLVGSVEFEKSFGKNKVEAKQIYSWLVNKGLKQEELRAVRLDKLKDAPDGTRMDQKDVLAYLKEHEARLRIVAKGPVEYEELKNQRTKMGERLYEVEKKLSEGAGSFTPEEFDSLMREAMALQKEDRDILLRMAEAKPGYEWVNAPGPSDKYQEILVFVDAPGFPEPMEERNNFYGHWNQKNMLVSLRVDERMTMRESVDLAELDALKAEHAEVSKREMTPGAWQPGRVGKLEERMRALSYVPTLTLLEVQSDLHQTGQDVGYQDEKGLVQAKQQMDRRLELLESLDAGNHRFDELTRRLRDVGFRMEDVSQQLWHLRDAHDLRNKTLAEYGAQITPDPSADQIARLEKQLEELAGEKFALEDDMKANRERRNALLDQIDEMIRIKQIPPDMPFKGTNEWTTLGLKVFLTEAVRRGYKRVAIPTREFSGLVETSGKSTEHAAGDYYEKTVPKEFSKLIKKHDPDARLGLGEVDTSSDSSYDMERSGRQTAVITLDITPKLAMAVERGAMTLWTKRPIQTMEEFYSVARRPGGIRAIEKDGKIYVALATNHLQMAKGMGIRLQDADSTGMVISTKDGLTYSGNNFYKAVKQGVKETLLAGKKIDESQIVLMDALPELDPGKADEIFFHDERAAAVFLENGRAFIEAIRSPNVGDLMHEMFHIVRRSLMSEEEVKTLERYFNVKDGKWTREHEELAADMMVKWFVEAIPATPELVPAFDALRSYLQQSYRISKEHNLPVNEEFARAMDATLLAETDPLRIARDNLAQLIGKVEFAQRRVMELEGDELQLNELAEAKKVLAEYQRAALNYSLIVGNFKKSFYAKEGETYPERRKRLLKAQTTVYSDLSDIQRVRIQKGLRDSLSSWFVSYFDRLGRSPLVDRLRELAVNREVEKNRILAHFETDFKNEVVLGVPTELKRQASEYDEYGQTTHTRMFEERWNVNPVPIPREMEGYKAYLRRLRQFEDEYNHEKHFTRELPSGDRVRTAGREPYVLARHLTEEGFYFIRQKSPERDEFIKNAFKLETLLRAKLGEDPIQFEDYYQQFESIANQYATGSTSMRTAGIIEFSRLLRILPDVYVGKNGNVTRIFHSDPAEYAKQHLRTFARRASMMTVFGGQLPNVFMRRGLIGKMLKMFGVQMKLERGALEKMVVSNGLGTAQEAAGLTLNKLRGRLQAAGISTRVDVADMWKTLTTLGPADLESRTGKKPGTKEHRAIVRERTANLKKLARAMKGVDTQAPLETMLFQMKDRVSRDIEDQLFSQFRTSYDRAGGDVRDFDAVWERMQEIPIAMPEKHLAVRIAQTFVLTPLNTSLTALAALWNPGQGFFGSVLYAGLRRTLKGFDDALMDFENVRAKGISRGAMKDVVQQWTFDTSYELQKYDRMARQGASIALGQTASLDAINGALSGVGERLVSEWSRDGIKKSDIKYAKRLMLTDNEIERINNGEMDDFLADKIVQQHLAMVQGHRQPTWMKAGVEIDPRVSWLFPFQAYSFTLARAVKQIGGDFADGIAQGDPKKVAIGAMSILSILGALFGNGFVRSMIRGVIQGYEYEDKDDVVRMLAQTTGDVIILGAAERFVAPPEWANSGAEFITSFSAPMAILGQFIDLVRGYGRVGRYPWFDKLMNEAERLNPILRALHTHLDRAAYPELDEYRSVRKKVGRWKARRREEAGEDELKGEFQSNPMYHDIGEAMARMDEELVHETARIFYETRLQSSPDPAKVMSDLRRSLVMRRPVNLNEDEFWAYISTLEPAEQRKTVELQMRYEALMDAVAPGAE